MANYIVIIPARYKSSRFSSKLLKLINGKPLITHTCEQCCKAIPKKK